MRRITALFLLAFMSWAAISASPVHAVGQSITVSNCEAGLDGQTISVPEGTQQVTIQFSATCTANTPPESQNPTQNPPNFALSSSSSITWTSTSATVQNTRATVSFGAGSPGSATINIQSTQLMTSIDSGTYTFYFAKYALTSTPSFSGSFSLKVGPGGGEEASVSTASFEPLPVLETLVLSVEANGATCTGGNPTGYAGAWLALPKAEDCKQTGPTAKAGSKLLGWSTHANFPIAAAQSQIDKGWGVIDGDINGVRMIFIPAGMSTFVSASNTLYPIWSA